MNLASLLDGAWVFAKAALALVTSIAPIVIAVFTWLTWRVYRQIKGVMKDSFESDFRPVVYTTTARVEQDESDRWTARLTLENVGGGVAHRVRFRTRHAANDEPSPWSDPEKLLGDMVPGETKGTPDVLIDDNVPRFDISCFDLYGNEFVTELRGKLLRYARMERFRRPKVPATSAWGAGRRTCRARLPGVPTSLVEFDTLDF